MFANCQLMGMDLAFPDICKTPPVMVPIPYPNFALGPMAIPNAWNVLILGMPAHNLLTTIPLSNGDNPGLGMGLVSQTIMSQARPITCVPNVLFGCIPATRLTGLSMQNTINTVGMRVVPSQPTVVLLGAGGGGGGGAAAAEGAAVEGEAAVAAEAEAGAAEAGAAEDLPTIEFSKTDMPKISENIEAAQAEGRPSVLTRMEGRDAIRAQRSAALKGQAKPPAGNSLDEYPFASSMEGGSGARVAEVPVREQNVQGGMLSRFYQDNGISHGDQFRVVVKP